MTCRVGANIHGFSVDRGRVEWFVRLVKPRVVTVVSNAELARDVLGWSGGESLVIFRHWWPYSDTGDDFLYTKVAAADYLADVMEQVGDKRIVLHLDNEPIFPVPLDNPERGAALRRWSDWALAGMAFAESQGWRCCVGNFAPANIAAADWNGALLPVLFKLSEGTHLLGTHDYRIEGHQEYPYIGQHQGADKAADGHGIARPMKVITELAPTRPEWQGQGFSEESYAAWLAAMDVAIYEPDGVLGECVYSFGNSGNWQHFDMKEKTAFWEAVAAWGRGYPAAPVVLPPLPPSHSQGEEEPGTGEPDVVGGLGEALLRIQALEAGVAALREQVQALDVKLARAGAALQG